MTQKPNRGLALITGASSGIGRATAIRLADDGYDLLVAARRRERLEELKSELLQRCSARVEVMSFDIQDFHQCEMAIQNHSALLSQLDILVNCAGVGTSTEPFHKIGIQDINVMVQTNLLGLLYMTRLVLPLMVERNSGHIINIGSVSGRWNSPRNAVYNATKHAVQALTESIRLDLSGRNIRVTIIEPGLTQTEFSHTRFGSKERADRMFEGIETLQPEDVAACISWALAQPPHVNVQELILFPRDQVGVGHINRKQTKKNAQD